MFDLGGLTGRMDGHHMPKTNKKQLFHVLASGGETGQDFSVFLLGWGWGVVWAIEVRYQDLRLHLLSSIFMLR